MEILIAAVLSGNASAEEAAFVEEWKNASEQNRILYAQYASAWNQPADSSLKLNIDIDAEWDRMNRYIRSGDKQIKRVIGIPRNTFYAAAAVVAFLLMSTLGYFAFRGQISGETVVASAGTMIQAMPDGSAITLNKGAQIRYASAFKGNTREVSLKGEAFFDVAPDKSKPFIIEAEKLMVKVVGTSFYVNAGADSTLVVVKSGKVAVYIPGHENEAVYLLPGQKASFTATGNTIEVKQNADNNYISWKTHIFEFNNTPLPEVLKQINKAYNCNMVLKNESFKECRITSTFDNLSLDQVIDILQKLLNLKIEKKQDCIELRGQGC